MDDLFVTERNGKMEVKVDNHIISKAQSDWGEADSSKRSYIKNKPKNLAVIKSIYVPNDWESGIVTADDSLGLNSVICATFNRVVPENAIVTEIRIRWAENIEHPEDYEDVSLDALKVRGLLDGSVNVHTMNVFLDSWEAYLVGGIENMFSVNGSFIADMIIGQGHTLGFTVYYMEVAR